MSVLTAKCDQLSPRELTKSLILSKKIFSKVQPAWNVWDAEKVNPNSDESESEEEAEAVGVDVKEANQIWNDVSKDLQKVGEENDHPEVGKEATESATQSPEMKPMKDKKLSKKYCCKS